MGKNHRIKLGNVAVAGKQLKQEVEIDGDPQKTKTNGHAETIEEKTIELSKSGLYDNIYLNRGINRVSSVPKFISPNLRPDIVAVRKDGKIDLFEVPSKTDDRDNLKERMKS